MGWQRRRAFFPEDFERSIEFDLGPL